MKQFARAVATDRARAEIAHGLLVLALRLHSLGCKAARDQLLLLSGFGLTEAELRDRIEVMGTEESQARMLLGRAQSSVTNRMADAMRAKAKGASAAGLRRRRGD
jgi:hypothetical protein